jgi:hypothetical protein
MSHSQLSQGQQTCCSGVGKRLLDEKWTFQANKWTNGILVQNILDILFFMSVRLFSCAITIMYVYNIYIYIKIYIYTHNTHVFLTLPWIWLKVDWGVSIRGSPKTWRKVQGLGIALDQSEFIRPLQVEFRKANMIARGGPVATVQKFQPQ